MTSYDRHEVSSRRIEYRVPVYSDGADWVEVMKAIRAIHNELWDLGLVDRGKDASADSIRIYGADEDVIVSYVLEEDARGNKRLA